MSPKTIPISGQVTGVAASDAARLTVAALRGKDVLATSKLGADGHYTLHLPRHAAENPYGLQVAVLPSVAASLPARVTNAPRARIPHTALRAGTEKVEGPHFALPANLIDNWSIYWGEWCVTGTLVGPDNCPAPAAAVTVYTVGSGSGGYTRQPRATTTTDINGQFTLCFPWWDFFSCWPCEFAWWDCWPWWWEEDILHVISTLEMRNTRGPNAASLFRPDAKALIRGQGFAGPRIGPVTQDAARTTLIAKKFANPALREIFPWHWWCCGEPNIVFGATQSGTTILNEDPGVDTRWCMEGGQTITLYGNSATLTCCGGGTGASDFTQWTNVGSFVVLGSTGSFVDANGLGQVGGDAVDMAFTGGLSLQADVETAVAYYQVSGTMLSGLPSRGAASHTGLPFLIGDPLYLPAYIENGGMLAAHTVQMGPFSANGLDNLYATPAARQGTAGLPALPPGTLLGWGDQGVVLQPAAQNLLNGAALGAVDLTLVGYDGGFNPLTLTPDLPLRLTIDTTALYPAPVIVSVLPTSGTPSTNTNCPAYDLSADTLTIVTDVEDTNGFLAGYTLEAEWGSNHTSMIPPGAREDYEPTVDLTNWTGGVNSYTFPGGATPPDGGFPTCCYEFRLRAYKRVTDGQTWLPETDYFQTVNLTF